MHSLKHAYVRALFCLAAAAVLLSSSAFRMKAQTLTPSADSHAPMEAKRAGVVRIGVVLPADTTAGTGESSTAEALRTAEMQLLTGPNVEAVKLHAVLPEQAAVEAKAIGCDFMMSSTLGQTTKPAAPVTGFARLKGLASRKNLQFASQAAMFIPGINGVGMMATMLGSQLFQTNLLSASKNVKADADVTLSYKLVDVNGASAAEGTQTAHASSNGENVLTPMLADAAAKVLKASGVAPAAAATATVADGD